MCPSLILVHHRRWFPMHLAVDNLLQGPNLDSLDNQDLVWSPLNLMTLPGEI